MGVDEWELTTSAVKGGGLWLNQTGFLLKSDSAETKSVCQVFQSV